MQRRKLALPPPGLGVEGVAGLAVHEEVPEPVQLPVLAEQVPAAEQGGIDVPDAHEAEPWHIRRRPPAAWGASASHRMRGIHEEIVGIERAPSGRRTAR